MYFSVINIITFLIQTQDKIKMSHQSVSISKLSKYELDLFNTIHNKIIPYRKKNFTRDSVDNNSKPEQKELVKPVFDKSLSILSEKGITDINENKYYLEFHQRNCGFEKKEHQIFDWHIDDDGAMSGLVYTVIFYLRKDTTVKGGDLDYKIQKKIHTHNVKQGDIVQFRGDVKHRPQPTSGFGCRDIIVVFIGRKKNSNI